MADRFAHVVLTARGVAHLDTAYTYRIPDGLAVAIGSVVRAPVRGRSHPGVVVGLLDEPDVARVQPLRALLGPALPEDVVDVCRSVADHYLSSLGEALASAIPPRVISEEDVRANTAPPPLAPPDFQKLSEYRNGPSIVKSIRSRGYAGFSWRPLADEQRSAIVASLATESVRRGRGVIVLLPDVKTRSDTADAILDQLGDHVAWLGSDVSQRERYSAWLALQRGERLVAVGGRAAVFAPVRNLGLMIVDDESHVSYKERRTPRFHARAVAAGRARDASACFVAIGAPPSAEADHACDRGVLTRVAPARAAELKLRPPVFVIDRTKADDRLVPSAKTLTALKNALERGDRAVLLIHRTGDEGRKISKRALRILPSSNPARLDARTKPEAFHDATANADLIVASPVIAKDLDLQKIGCVAIVEADAALASAEFRATEEAFATWWRAGRWLDPSGTFAIETDQPRHPAIAALVRWSPDALWRHESERRKTAAYPPFAAFVRVDTSPERARDVERALKSHVGAAEILGPAERENRSVFLVRSADRPSLLLALRPLAKAWRAEGVDVRLDVDPREVLP